MAVFSIREYALNMRTTDSSRCWPFGDKVKKESVEALLPPMAVTKFRWWSHELELLKSNCSVSTEEQLSLVARDERETVDGRGAAENSRGQEEEKLEKICPVCRVFATATVNAMNAHIDSCLAQTSKERRWQMNKAIGKSKSRTPKKRSIAEIFAVAPPIETVVDESEKVVGKQAIDVKIKASSLARSLVSAMKTIKAKKKSKLNECRSASKENDVPIVSKLEKNKNKFKYAKREASIVKKDIGQDRPRRNRKRNRRDVSICCRKPCFKRLSQQKKHKLVKKCKLIAKQQRPSPPIRSILKHSIKVVSETNPSSSNLNGSDHHVIINGGQRSDRHVSFLDKDDVLGPRTKIFSDVFERRTIGNPFRDSSSVSEGNNASGESNKGVAPIEVSLNGDIVSFSTIHRSDSQQIKGNVQLPGNIRDQVNVQSSSRPHPCWDNMKHSAEKLISANRVTSQENNLHLFDHGYLTAPHQPTHSGIPNLLGAQEERQFAPMKAQFGLNIPRPAHTFNVKSVDHFINPIHGVPATSSMTSTIPSFSSENAFSRFCNFSESSVTDASKLNFHHELFPTRMEMMNSRPSFPNWERNAVAYREKGVKDEFFCLPLNSKGELIQLNSGMINRYDQMNEAGNSMACSSSSVPACGLVLPTSTRDYFVENEKLLLDRELRSNQLTLFPLHSNMQENQNQYFPARFDVTEPGTSRTADIELLNSDRGTESGSLLHSNLIGVPFNRCRYYGKLPSQNAAAEIYHENSNSMLVNPARQTMRLMGKDVAVGGNGKEIQEFEGVNFWKNKGTLVENCPTSSVQENPIRKRSFLQDWMPHHPSKGEPVLYPSSYHSCQQIQSNLLTNPPQYMFPHPCLNKKCGIVYKRSDSAINLNERFRNIHAFSPSSAEAFHVAPNFQEPFISCAEKLRFGSQSPAFSTSHHLCQNRYGNSFELGCNQNLPPAKFGTFNFPFLHPDDENHIQLPRFHSSKNLPSSILHANQRVEVPSATSKLTDINGYYYPLISSGTNGAAIPYVHRLPEASYTCSSIMPSHLPMKNVPGSTPMFQPIPVVSRVQVPSFVNTCHGSRTNSEGRLKSNDLSVKDSDLSNRSTKRPASELIDSRKRQKIASLGMNNFSVMKKGWTRGNVNNDLQSNRDKDLSTAGNIPILTQNDGATTSPTAESSNIECMARAGPIKLAAGAKHILKPSQSMDLRRSQLKNTFSFQDAIFPSL